MGKFQRTLELKISFRLIRLGRRQANSLGINLELLLSIGQREPKPKKKKNKESRKIKFLEDKKNPPGRDCNREVLQQRLSLDTFKLDLMVSISY